MALGVSEALAEAAAALGWTEPTEIQREALPHALQGAMRALFILLYWCVCVGGGTPSPPVPLPPPFFPFFNRRASERRRGRARRPIARFD